MARQYGANASLLIKKESTYGTAPAGNYLAVPFVSDDATASVGLIESELLGYGRDRINPSYDKTDVSGNIVIPVDTENIGVWLAGLLGAASTTGAGPYTHVWDSGADTLLSFSAELGMPDAASFIMRKGLMVNSIEFTCSPSGPATATVAVIAKSEARAGTTGGGTPTTLTLLRFSQMHAYVKREGTNIANLTSARLNLSNNLDAVEVVSGGGEIAGADPTQFSASGDLVVRFADTTLLTDATSGTPVNLVFLWDNATDSLEIELFNVYLPVPKRSVTGPGGVEATFAFQAAKDPGGADPMATVTLINGYAGTLYA